MCRDCGCGQIEEVAIHGGHHHHHHHHDHAHSGADHLKQFHHLSDEDLKQEVLAYNSRVAVHNREHFDARSVLCFNMISAPGSGKTTLLQRLITDWIDAPPMKVIQGDLQTENDAERIRQAGVEAIQVNTGQGCHLDADMIHKALHRLELPQHSVLVIENVGNMVCPADFDLGEHHKVAVIACTEGADKPAKYPGLIKASDVLLINKIDLLPYVDFDTKTCERLARELNPEIKIFRVSATTGEGLEQFSNWITENRPERIV